MRQFFTTLFSVALVGSILLGCKGGDGAQGPSGPALTGSIIGFVQLANEDHSYPTVKNGVTVTVPGSGVSAISDSSGKFVLSGLTTGTLDIVASKTGYADAKIVSVPFAGGGTFLLSSWWGTMTLDHLPSFEVATAVAAPAGSNISVTGTINTTASWYRYAVFYVGKQAGVSISNPTSIKMVSSVGINGSSNAFSGTLYSSSLNQAGFVSGDTVYVSAYSAGGQYYNSQYLDAATGLWLYSSLGTVPKATKAVMP